MKIKELPVDEFKKLELAYRKEFFSNFLSAYGELSLDSVLKDFINLKQLPESHIFIKTLNKLNNKYKKRMKSEH